MHMTADGSRGVILWTEDPGRAEDPSKHEHFIVQRLDFTVETNADLILEGDPVTLLPLPGEEVPPEDSLTYRSMDIWGDATHDSLYMEVRLGHGINVSSGTGVSCRLRLRMIRSSPVPKPMAGVGRPPNSSISPS